VYRSRNSSCIEHKTFFANEVRWSNLMAKENRDEQGK
jgi:hypothetical protein